MIFIKILGWKIDGSLPLSFYKGIIAVAPHTSNWDFCIGFCVRSILKFQSNYLIKKELFKYKLLAWFFAKTGGVPVDRKNKKVDLVSAVVEQFNQRNKLVLAIAPEGTRSYVKQWKTGFYRIAYQAKVPIALVYFDYKNKVVSFFEIFEPTGDMEKEIAYIKSKYIGIQGKNPEKGVY